MAEIETKDQKNEVYLRKKDFMGAFAYWVIMQSPYVAPTITPALIGFSNYMDEKYPNRNVTAEPFTVDSLSNLINEDVFRSIPTIEKLGNLSDPDGFIDLEVLAKNIVRMVLYGY